MQQSLNTSDTAMNASLALFIFVTAFFPLMWAAFGDAIGRRPIYLISIFIAVLANVGCALSTNVIMLIVFRAVTGIGSSSVSIHLLCLIFPEDAYYESVFLVGNVYGCGIYQ